VLGKSNVWGYLQEGRHADIAILNEVYEPFYLQDHENNILKSKKSYRCFLTICDGQVVYRD
jgi:predicted amidohydrolase YtcJ